METILLYILKTSGLITAFYLAYIFLLRKETFYTSNRWFLLAGLLTSFLLPLYFIKKVVFIERPKVNFQDVTNFSATNFTSLAENPIVESFDWSQVLLFGYMAVVLFLAGKILFSFASLHKMTKKGQVVKNDNYKLIYLNENSAPFSFFSTIVINPKLYSEEEFQSIICHEKIHCQEKHSIDVLVSQLLCIGFWFNPIIWFYHKAIVQNLEFIADQKATQQLKNLNGYQKALLKVASSQNCLSITNHFNKSLIKKRIIMLNTNPSQKINTWKYFSMLPLLIGFVFFFQVKVQAQIKEETATPMKENKIENQVKANPNDTENTLNLVIDKISSDDELKSDCESLKERFNIDLKVNRIKRNANGEIIELKLSFNDNKGKKGTTEQIRTIPIRPIFLKVHRQENGEHEIGFFDNQEMKVLPKDVADAKENKIKVIESLKDDAVIYVDGELYDKESLEYLDVNGIESIKILNDVASLEKYDATGKKEVVVIETNWETKKNANESQNIKKDDVIIIAKNIKNNEKENSSSKLNKKLEYKKALILFNLKEISWQEMDAIDPETIESFNVLKTSQNLLKKYGKKAKNGVIEITTIKDSKKVTKVAETKSITLFSMKSDFDLLTDELSEIAKININRKDGENVIVILNENVIEGDLNLFTKSELKEYTEIISNEPNLSKGLFLYQNKKLTKIDYQSNKIDKLYEKSK